MRWEWTDRNPAASAKLPTLNRQTILATSPGDVAKVIAEARARSTAMGLYLWFVVVTGIRRGELCGLQIRDVDLGRALVHVARTLAGARGKRDERQRQRDARAEPDRLHVDPLSTRLVFAIEPDLEIDIARPGGSPRP